MGHTLYSLSLGHSLPSSAWSGPTVTTPLFLSQYLGLLLVLLLGQLFVFVLLLINRDKVGG